MIKGQVWSCESRLKIAGRKPAYAAQVFFAILCFGQLFLAGYCYGGQTLQQEIDELKRVFGWSDTRPIPRAVQQLRWAGISDAELFDLIDRRFQRNLESGKDKNLTVLLARALSYSGDLRFKTSLAKGLEAKSGSIRKASEQALLTLEQYAVYNPVISQGVDTVSPLQIPVVRIANMIGSGDPYLMRYGGSFAYKRYPGHPDLVTVAAKILAEEYLARPDDEVHTDAMAYLIKVLISSGSADYIPLLAEIYATAPNAKIKRYANDALARLGVF